VIKLRRQGQHARATSALLVLVLAACGGIEGTGSPQAGIEGTGLTEGVLTTFDGGTVDGVAFATDNADIVVDGMPSDASALQPGMVVGVAGEPDADGTQYSASRVEFDRPLYGPVDSIDPAARHVTVLGQPVQLDDATLFDGVAEEDLREGQVCLVSGYARAGGWLATLLKCSEDYAPGITLVEVEGALETLQGQDFTLGALGVDGSAAHIDTAGGSFSEGAWVEVIGTQQQLGGTLVAEYIRVKKAIAEQPVDKTGSWD
jgi:hypothetical protein